MKILIQMAALLFLTSSTSFGQYWFDDEEEKEKRERGNTVMNEEDLMITFYGSYPNFGKYLAQTAFINSGVTRYSTAGIAPVGFQFEYMLSNRIGFTMDGIFNSYSAEWRYDYSLYDPVSGTFSEVSSENSFAQTRYRLLFGLNYHFDELENEKFSFYSGAALGINNTKREFDVVDEWTSTFWDFFIAYPIAFRARSGVRFFINDNLGLNFELGAGGPVLRFGLTYRFVKDLEKEKINNKM